MPRAHVLADMSGYQPGESVPITEIPLQLVDIDGRQLTWQGTCVAARVAARITDRFAMSGHTDTWRKWSAVAEYLARWQHHVM